jgi:uncharacterized protein YhfF
MAQFMNKTDERKIQFEKGSTFKKKGLNLTVRLGDKWRDYKGDIVLTDDEDNVFGQAEIVKTKFIRFNLIEEEQLKEEQKANRTIVGLKNQMKRSYQFAFSQESMVTMVYFKLK